MIVYSCRKIKEREVEAGKSLAANDFALKFRKLNKHNQKYILGIEQVMLYAHDSEKTETKQQKGKR